MRLRLRVHAHHKLFGLEKRCGRSIIVMQIKKLVGLTKRLVQEIVERFHNLRIPL